MSAASRLWRCGRAWVERPGLPASCSCGTPVSVRLAVSGWAGEGGAGRFAVVRGRSADPRWLGDLWPLTGQLACSAVLAHALVGAVTRARRAPLAGPLHNKLALLLALV